MIFIIYKLYINKSINWKKHISLATETHPTSFTGIFFHIYIFNV